MSAYVAKELHKLSPDMLALVDVVRLLTSQIEEKTVSELLTEIE